MRLFQNTQNQPHQKTYQRVYNCLLETNNVAKDKLSEKLKQQKGLLAQFKYLLFVKPNIILLIPFVIFLCLLPPTYIIYTFQENSLIRQLFMLFCILIYLIIPLFVVRITPKLDMGLHERWSKVMSCCMKTENWNNNLKQAKRDINRAILSHRWEGKPLGFFVNLLWGGIFIGCLPDPDFQKALITMSFSTIFQANLFGSMCLLFLPFIYIYYFVNFETPIAWMELIIAQIEIEFEE